MERRPLINFFWQVGVASDKILIMKFDSIFDPSWRAGKWLRDNADFLPD